jgi:hypothetical protein
MTHKQLAIKKHRATQKRVMKYGLAASGVLLVFAIIVHSVFFGFIAVMSALIHTITK